MISFELIDQLAVEYYANTGILPTKLEIYRGLYKILSEYYTVKERNVINGTPINIPISKIVKIMTGVGCLEIVEVDEPKLELK